MLVDLGAEESGVGSDSDTTIEVTAADYAERRWSPRTASTHTLHYQLVSM